MVDATSFDHRILPLTQYRIVEGLQYIDQHLFIRIPLVRERRIIGHERERLRSDLSGIETIQFLLGLFQDYIALLIVADELKSHPSIHAIEHTASPAIFLFGLLHNGVGALGV